MFNHISTQANKLVSLTKKIHSKSKTKVLSITSGKGGVGKSTISSNIAYILAKKGLNVAILDADIGLANLQVIFDLKPSFTINDYLDGSVELNDILLKTKYKNITLIAGKSGHKYTYDNISMLFSRVVEDIVALNRYDILIVDTGAGIHNKVQEFLNISDEILAVTTTDPSAITDVYALLKMISQYKKKLFICFNYTNRFDVGQSITNSLINLASKNKLNRKFMVQYVGNISESKSVATTSRLRKLFVQEFQDEMVSLELEMIADKIMADMGYIR